MELRDIATLKKWDKNPKTQTKEEHERMVERFKQMGQLTAFLVMPDGFLLGGNHGLDAMSELGETKAKCIPVDFIQEGDEWFLVNDGNVVRHISYKSKEEGMLRVSIAHNERFSSYSDEMLGNFSGNLGIELKDLDYGIDFYPQSSIDDMLKRDEGEKKAEPATTSSSITEVKCPNCGHVISTKKT